MEPATLHNDNLSLGNSIKTERLAKQMTVEELATRCGLSPAMISKIENGHGNPSINSLRNIAKALGVPMAVFFAQEDEARRETIYVNNKKTYTYPKSKVTYTAIVGPVSDDFKFFMIESLPGSKGGNEAICHKGFEQGMVIEGELELTVGDQVFLLKQYDTIAFPSTIPHRWVNKSGKVARSVWAIAVNHPLGSFGEGVETTAAAEEALGQVRHVNDQARICARESAVSHDKDVTGDE